MVNKALLNYISIVNFSAIGFISICSVGGIILNAYFIKRNKVFINETEKLSDVKFFFSLLAIFNIFHLVDGILFGYFLIKVDYTSDNSLFCKFYSYYTQVIIFCMFYCIVIIAKDSFILSQNNPKYKFSNRFQIFSEAFAVWAVYLTLFFFFNLYFFPNRECSKVFLTIPTETLSYSLLITSLIFIGLTYCYAKNLNDETSEALHFIQQARKTCIIYFLSWFPTTCLNTYSWILLYFNIYHFNETEYFFRVYAYVLLYICSALFPFFCKERTDIVVEHELI
ncbi:UNVERIFIED_CONTAM: hypothetical protein RMT77_005643 [Armadillidium vulgare]